MVTLLDWRINRLPHGTAAQAGWPIAPSALRLKAPTPTANPDCHPQQTHLVGLLALPLRQLELLLVERLCRVEVRPESVRQRIGRLRTVRHRTANAANVSRQTNKQAPPPRLSPRAGALSIPQSCAGCDRTRMCDGVFRRVARDRTAA